MQAAPPFFSQYLLKMDRGAACLETHSASLGAWESSSSDDMEEVEHEESSSVDAVASSNGNDLNDRSLEKIAEKLEFSPSWIPSATLMISHRLDFLFGILLMDSAVRHEMKAMILVLVGTEKRYLTASNVDSDSAEFS
jgi:hypothetical protein